MNALNAADGCLDKLGLFCSGRGPIPPLPVYQPVLDPVIQPQPQAPWTVQPHFEIPAWVGDILFYGGVAALIAFCAFDPEFAWICPLILPQIKRGVPAF